MESVVNGRIALLGDAAVLDAERAEYAAGPKCGACRFWRKTPQPRAAGGAVDLSVPVVGECRYELRSSAIIQNSPQGPVLLGFASGYPSNVPAEFPSCSHFAVKQPTLERENVHA